MDNIDEVFETAMKVALHPLSRFQPALVSCAIHCDLGAQSALKRRSDLNSVDVDVFLVLMGILL
jgi:hypothetical protein